MKRFQGRNTIEQLINILNANNNRYQNHNFVVLNVKQAEAFKKFNALTADGKINIPKLIDNPQIFKNIQEYLRKNISN